MSTAPVIDYEIKENALPACLPPWLENPYRLLSLWDIVIQFSGESLFWSGYALDGLMTDCLLNPGPGNVKCPVAVRHDPIDDKLRQQAFDWLKAVYDVFRRIGMPVSLIETIEELRAKLDPADPGAITYEDLRTELKSIWKISRKELTAKTFLYITREKIRFWPTLNQQDVFGAAVSTAFPSATLDISEAGICLALSRPIASVFHLMRALEVALGVLGALFNVSLTHTNWAPAIEKIESAIREMHKDPIWKAMPNCKEQQEFYSQAASHFGILKDAWRNYTAHARGVYTEDKATLIFDNVAAFMQTLAIRLHE